MWRKLFRSLSPGCWAGLAMMTNPAAVAPPGGWSVIQPLHESYVYVRPKAGEAVSHTAYLETAAGETLYKLECHNGGFPDESEMQFTGDFQCALFPIKGDTLTPVNLLATDTRAEQSVDWRNRGRMIAAQLQGECLQYPEYSSLRHFKLRGLDLTLGYAELVWEKGAKGPVLSQFTLSVDAVPDADAKSPLAETAEGDRPPKTCYP